MAPYTVTESPGEMCGAPLEGAGEEDWPGSIEAAIAVVEGKGLRLGDAVACIQHAGGKLYYYAPGEESGEAGDAGVSAPGSGAAKPQDSQMAEATH